jgi:hypothetical protein
MASSSKSRLAIVNELKMFPNILRYNDIIHVLAYSISKNLLIFTLELSIHYLSRSFSKVTVNAINIFNGKLLFYILNDLHYSTSVKSLVRIDICFWYVSKRFIRFFTSFNSIVGLVYWIVYVNENVVVMIDIKSPCLKPF